MKILALVTDAYEGYGGIAQSNRDIFKALDSNVKVEKMIILPRLGPSQPIIISKKTKQFPAFLNRISFSLKALKIYFKEGPFDIIFCGHLYMFPLAIALSAIFKKQFWLHLHGIEAWPVPSRIIQRLIKKAKWITTVSRYTRKRFLSWADVDPDQVKVLSNTFDESFKVAAHNQEIINQYQLQGKKIILAVSRLSRAGCHKGYDRVFFALQKLLQKRSDFIYLIIGDGDGKEELEVWAKSCGLENHVRFMGKLSKTALIQFYQLADLFVMHSHGEGFGIVFLEAMACGLRVICGNADGSRDPLQDGLLGDNVDEAALEETIQNRLNEPWNLKDRSELSKKVTTVFHQTLFDKGLYRILTTF